jgi:hypoxanthine phosphoribosyltransferase
MTKNPYDYENREGIRAISWEDFHGLCKGLVKAAAEFQPDVILPVGRGGYYPGALMAHMLQAEIYPVRLSRRVHDEVKYGTPKWIMEPPEAIRGKKVLIVDEISASGETINLVKDKAEKLGAEEVRSAVLYAHRSGAAAPDYIGIISDALLLNPWDREIWKEGKFQAHPEYMDALRKQGVDELPVIGEVIEAAKRWND